MSKIQTLLLQYLASSDTKRAVLDGLRRSPREAFDAILGFRGPYPKTIHPIAVHEEYLTPLLAELLTACPTPEVKRRLLELMAMRSIANNAYCMERIQEAVSVIDGQVATGAEEETATG